MKTIIAFNKFKEETWSATMARRLKWIAMRDISSVHIIPYREWELSPDTADIVALILAFLRRVGPPRPKAGTRRGERDFGRISHAHVCACARGCAFLD